MNPYRNELAAEFAGRQLTFVITFEKLAKVEGLFGTGLVAVLERLARNEVGVKDMKAVLKLFTTLKDVEIENGILTDIPAAMKLVSNLILEGFKPGRELPKEQAVSGSETPGSSTSNPTSASQSPN